MRIPRLGVVQTFQCPECGHEERGVSAKDTGFEHAAGYTASFTCPECEASLNPPP